MLWQQISVTEESRLYTAYSPDTSKNCVNLNSGIVRAKAELNWLHQKLAKEGYTQVLKSTYVVVKCTNLCSMKENPGSAAV